LEIIKTTEDLCKYIWQLEDKYNLLDLEISDIKIWQYKRMQIFYLLSRKIGLYQMPHSKQSKSEKFINLYSYIKYSFINNPFLIKQTDDIIFDHPRTKFVNGENIDIYTHYFIQEFINNKKKIKVLERPYLGKHIKKKNSYRSYLDFIILITNLFKSFVRIKNNDELNIIKNLEKEIDNDLMINSNLSNLMISGIKEFKIRYKLFNILLKKVQPKNIYVIVSYVYGDLIKAAKDLNIKTYELQHGTFSKYHLGYSFPNRKKALEYFPDFFIVWNDYWKNLIDIPIDYKNIMLREFDYLKNEKAKYSNIMKINNQIVILSQGAIGENIATVILDNFKKLENYKILYKLHPGEYKDWKSNKALFELSKKNNVEICLNVDLYTLLASSSIQIGVFSTAIYEGIEFGCETILLDLPGIEYMEDLMKMKKAIIFNDWLKNND
jgi:hypothetical protein